MFFSLSLLLSSFAAKFILKWRIFMMYLKAIIGLFSIFFYGFALPIQTLAIVNASHFTLFNGLIVIYVLGPGENRKLNSKWKWIGRNLLKSNIIMQQNTKWSDSHSPSNHLNVNSVACARHFRSDAMRREVYGRWRDTWEGAKHTHP